MRLFSGLEDSLEKYIEGFFKDKVSSEAKVQPTDIAKKLARAMRDKRRVSVSNIYVPNRYTVSLHPSDYKIIVPMAPLLASEMSDYLVQKAEEKKFTPVGRPQIHFAEGEGLEPGDISIESDFSVSEMEEMGIPQGTEVEDDFQDTKNYQPLRDTAPIPKLTAGTSASLYVEEGNDTGVEFPLGDFRNILGRRDTCDIVLSDNSISRRHAQIEKNAGRYWISDLNSTNGTFVNGLPIEKHELTSGDAITMGNTVLIFKEF